MSSLYVWLNLFFIDKRLFYGKTENCKTVAAFNNDPKGRGYAMRTVLRRMAASGEIAEIPKSEMFLQYQSSVLAYRVLNREAFVGKKGAA